ncbi:MAG: serine--tRNA ligase [Hyphomicrobiaceae bacterium]|nr:serine--tRNA ligase [Hyphomicrobiaceae bacterium]
MFDIRWIRDNPEAFDEGLRKRGLAPLSAKLLEIDEARRRNLTALQDAQSRRNAASKEIGKAKAAKDEARARELMKEVNSLKEAIQAGEAEAREIEARLNSELAQIPNLPLADVPVGADESGNVEVRRVGIPPAFDFTPKQHFEIGEALGLMDFETAAKLSGARFVVLKGALARLERALAAFMLDLHTTELGYTEANPPLLVRDDAAFGTGNLPKFENDLFQTASVSFEDVCGEIFAAFPKDDDSSLVQKIKRRHLESAIRQRLNALYWTRHRERFWLIPTAEVSLTNFVREQILDEAALPLRYTAWTPCFRSEAGAAGKDTRGMIRQHQFSKVELVSITTPEQSLAEHERMTACAEEVLKRLGLAYRTMLLCTGDMGFASQKTYDIEVWLPGQNAYREISSCSVCGDFQARRMNARYRPKDGRPAFVHTLNGSGLAVGRTLIAVLENYQQPDGSVGIPEVLRPYMRGLERIEKAS